MATEEKNLTALESQYDYTDKAKIESEAIPSLIDLESKGGLIMRPLPMESTPTKRVLRKWSRKRFTANPLSRQRRAKPKDRLKETYSRRNLSPPQWQQD